jgi:NMD protein affecting ribosome stability and mRNA decay
MKRRGLARVDRKRVRSLDHRGVRTDKAPPVAAEAAYRDPTVCESCSAVYRRKTWRRTGRRLYAAIIAGADWALCPACRQVRSGRCYGRVILRGPWLGTHEDEVRRRIDNVVDRARHTQPERRLLAVERQGTALEVKTTSQKLAHRLVHELRKAFGGDARYSWSDRDGALTAVWSRE